MDAAAKNKFTRHSSCRRMATSQIGSPESWYSWLHQLELGTAPPDRFPALATLSLPFRPRSPARPTSLMPRRTPPNFINCTFKSQVKRRLNLSATHGAPDVVCRL